MPSRQGAKRRCNLVKLKFPSLLQRRKWLGHDGLVVVKKAASKRHQNRGERRQKGDHTHYETPKRETTDALPNHSLVRLVVAKLQQKSVK